MRATVTSRLLGVALFASLLVAAVSTSEENDNAALLPSPSCNATRFGSKEPRSNKLSFCLHQVPPPVLLRFSSSSPHRHAVFSHMNPKRNHRSWICDVTHHASLSRGRPSRRAVTRLTRMPSDSNSPPCGSRPPTPVTRVAASPRS